MSTGVDPHPQARHARSFFAEAFVRGLGAVVESCRQAARDLCDQPCEPALALRRRDALTEITRSGEAWRGAIVDALRGRLSLDSQSPFHTSVPPRHPESATAQGEALSLVDDETIESEILVSRLALAIVDKAGWEHADLASRVASLDGRAELDADDLLRGQVLAGLVHEAWVGAGLTASSWRVLGDALHRGVGALVRQACDDTLRWLAERGVQPQASLRPAIVRAHAPGGESGGSDSSRRALPEWAGHEGMPPSAQGPAAQGFFAASAPGVAPPAGAGAAYAQGTAPYLGAGAGAVPPAAGGLGPAPRPASWPQAMQGVADETRLMTQRGQLLHSREEAGEVIGRLNRLVARHVPAFGAPTRPMAVSPGLARAIDAAEAGLREQWQPHEGLPEALPTTPALLDDLERRRQELKRAAATPEERATIEIVALMFQSLLMEERIPASVRVLFARLQMPVLRVAVQEPDFFASLDHPARRLIDRMGACVMGFDSGDGTLVGEPMEREIRRIVQVVEAYPDTGRRVFETVLRELEKFLEAYFRDHHEGARAGVSLAQQVEQRETLAIQFTIELRRMLSEVPVPEGVRDFLFQVWADVLATTAVRDGVGGEVTRRMKRAAADLIWAAAAKLTREDRSEVIRRLPALLKALREGMAATGMAVSAQDEQIDKLNTLLAAAFSARTAVIPGDRLSDLMHRLDTLEELLPDEPDLPIDDETVTELSSLTAEQAAGLEVVSEGGSMPTAAMLAWARELQVGGWYRMELGGRVETVQLAWQGLRKQMTLFAGANGRCVLFTLQRLASYLQAGLLLPAQDEALTVRATRDALARLDIDVSRLFH